MTTAIVGVHGIGNYQPGYPPSMITTHLARAWRAALTRGQRRPLPKQTTVTCAYYAHHLRAEGAQSAATVVDQLSPVAVELIAEWLDLLDPPGTAQGRLTRGLRRDIGLFANRSGLNRRTTNTVISMLAAEVTRYLDPNEPRRFLARTEVANTISAANRTKGTTTVIAHSLGSVVTYETLHAYPQLRVDHLITIGSPLALPHSIFDRLDPAPRPRGQRPPNTYRWTNIADVGDIVAVPPRGLPGQFDGVDKDIETTIHWADFHLASNYLKSDAVAEALGMHSRPF